MQPKTELNFELPAQEAVDPDSAITDPIEFDDLDTVLMPAVPPANETAPAKKEETAASDLEIELTDLEIELEAEDIDSLLAG